MFFDPVPEAARVDAEDLGRTGLYAAGARQGLDDHPLFDPGQPLVQRSCMFGSPVDR